MMNFVLKMMKIAFKMMNIVQRLGVPAAAPADAPKKNTEKPQLAPEIPGAGEVFRVVSPSGAVVRKAFLGTSSQCGSLQRGESVSVLEAQVSEEIPGNTAAFPAIM